MADLLGDGNVKVTFVITVADPENPTAAELNAGVDLQTLITKDGLDIAPDQASVDNTALASRTETEDAGTVSYKITVTAKRQQASVDDVAWNTLVDGQLGYLAVRRNLPHETAWAATQNGENYPVRCGRPNMQPPALNTPQRFVSKLFNHSEAFPDVTVA